MDKIVKVGMVGTGFVGDLHHAAFKGWVHNAEVVAVSSPSNAEKFAHERGIPQAYSDYREMLKDPDIDVVDIGIPNDLHHQVVVDAARAGKHVIIEKPLCVTGGEVAAAAQAVAAAGVVLGVGHERRFEPAVMELRTRIAASDLGTPLLLEANFSQDKFLGMPRDHWRFSTADTPVVLP